MNEETKQYLHDFQGWLTLYEINNALKSRNEKKKPKKMILLEYHIIPFAIRESSCRQAPNALTLRQSDSYEGTIYTIL